MTAQTRKTVAENVLAFLVGLIATLFVLFGTGAWSGKENTSDHDRDIAAVLELQSRTLDAICDGRQSKPHACTAPRPDVGKRTPP